MENQTIVYRYDSEEGWATHYSFDEPIPVGIWNDACKIRISDLVD